MIMMVVAVVVLHVKVIVRVVVWVAVVHLVQVRHREPHLLHLVHIVLTPAKVEQQEPLVVARGVLTVQQRVVVNVVRLVGGFVQQLVMMDVTPCVIM